MLYLPPSLVTQTSTTAISTLSLHDALPICRCRRTPTGSRRRTRPARPRQARSATLRGRHRSKHRHVEQPASSRFASPESDRKSTRLNSSHLGISYAVFCLEKKNQREEDDHR